MIKSGMEMEAERQRTEFAPEIQEFAVQMGTELSDNVQKGNWSSWRPSSFDVLENAIRWNLLQLKKAVEAGEKQRVREIAADLGNYAMKAYFTFGK